MSHGIYRVISCQQTGSYQLRIGFDDSTEREIDFHPLLAGQIYGPLKRPELFAQVRIDSEVHTLVWPNGADFDPATLHDWPEHESAWLKKATQWEQAANRVAG